MNFDQPNAKKDDVEKKVLEAKQTAEAKEFNAEAEREKIYAHANERRQKLFAFRNEMFEEAGKAKESAGYKSGIRGNTMYPPAEYAAFSDAHSRALDKIKFGSVKDEDAQLTPDEKAALLYQRKYNEIEREMELAIASLEERIKVSNPQETKPEEVTVEEPKLKLADLEKRISEI